MLVVTYTTTVEDYVAYSMRSVSRSPMMRLRFLALWLLLPVALLARAVTLFVVESWESGLGSAFVGCVYLAVFPFFYRKSVAKSIRRFATELGTKGIVGSIRLQLTEESLVMIIPGVRSEVDWRYMDGMEVVGDCTYLQLSPLSAAIIPKWGFEREEDYFAVRDFAAARLNRPELTSAATT